MNLTCELCSGKIVHGRCTECGMDYTRMKNRYHLNENCDDYDQNARSINKNYENTLETSEEKQQQHSRTVKVRQKETAKPNVPRKPERTAAQPNMSAGSKTPAKKENGFAFWFIIIIAILCLLRFGVSALVEGVNNLLGNPFDLEAFSEYDYSQDAGESTDGSVSYNDLPGFGDGLSVDFELAQGVYLVGKDIPAGDYTLVLLSDNVGDYWIDNSEYGLYDSNWLADGMAGTVIKGFRLIDGTTVTIGSESRFEFISDNAQLDEDQIAGLSVLSQGVGDAIPVITDDTYFADFDISAGEYLVRYTIEADDELVCTIYHSEEDYEEEICIGTNYYDEGEQTYYGIDLEEGDSVTFSANADYDSSIELVPLRGALE